MGRNREDQGKINQPERQSTPSPPFCLFLGEMMYYPTSLLQTTM